MDKKKIRFGIIGFGAIGPRHKDKIEQTENAEIVAVCDVDESRRNKAAGNGVLLFADYKEMLKLSSLDVVSVCTPNDLHAPMSIDALRAGKHVLCEKPMALTAKDCKAMVHTSLRENRKLFIVKQNRYNPPILAVKNLIDENRLGKLFYIVVNCFWNRNNGYYEHSSWRGIKSRDGGALFTQFSHFIDLMLMFAGSVESVYTIANNFLHPNLDIEDTGVVSVKFSNGIIGSLNFTNNAYKANMEGSITIFAEKGTIKIGGQYLNKLEYQRLDGEAIPELDEVVRPNDYGTYQGSMSNHDKVYKNVVDSLNNGGKVAVNGIDGMETTEFIEAAYQSVVAGTCIKL